MQPIYKCMVPMGTMGANVAYVYTVLIVIAIVAQGCVWLLYTYSMEVFPTLTMHMYTIPQTLMSRSGCYTRADGAKSGNQAPNETPSSLSSTRPSSLTSRAWTLRT